MIFLLKQSRGSQGSPADHRSESRLSIPRRGALQRSSSPLPQPSSILKRTVEITQNYSVNGKCVIIRLSQLWGASHSVQMFTSRVEDPFSRSTTCSVRRSCRSRVLNTSPGELLRHLNSPRMAIAEPSPSTTSRNIFPASPAHGKTCRNLRIDSHTAQSARA